jgi:hypothetical protein
MAFIAGPGYVALPRKGGAWIIEDLLPIGGGLLNVFGQPKKGKSYLALQLAAAIADPQQDVVLGFPVQTHGPVAYLQIDTPRALWAERLENLTALGMCFDNVMMADQELVPYPFNILGEGFGWLQQNLKLIAPFPVAVVVDTLREIHGGEENDSGHMRNVVNLMVEAVRPASLILLSHARKEFGDASNGSLMSDNRGSSYVPGRMDCVLKVNDTSLQFQGRTVGESRVVVKRDPESGLFVVSDDFDRVARAILEETAGLSTMARAKALQEKFPKKSIEACRSLIRRLERASTRSERRPESRRIDLTASD